MRIAFNVSCTVSARPSNFLRMSNAPSQATPERPQGSES
jgi:hypothetical protein